MAATREWRSEETEGKDQRTGSDRTDIKEGASQVSQRPFQDHSERDYGVIVTVFGTGLVLVSVPTSVQGLPDVALESE